MKRQSMKKHLSLFLLGLMLSTWQVSAADVQLIANPSVGAAELSADDVKEIFLGTKTAVAGGDVQPVLANGGAAHDAFLKAYVGKSDQGLRNHFKSLVFTGKGSMPKSFATDADVAKYVAATKGAIGYVSAGADIGSAKKIAVK
jgi:ABC-type phosphate transport system substrate-binding protein